MPARTAGGRGKRAAAPPPGQTQPQPPDFHACSSQAEAELLWRLHCGRRWTLTQSEAIWPCSACRQTRRQTLSGCAQQRWRSSAACWTTGSAVSAQTPTCKTGEQDHALHTAFEQATMTSRGSFEPNNELCLAQHLDVTCASIASCCGLDSRIVSSLCASGETTTPTPGMNMTGTTAR